MQRSNPEVDKFYHSSLWKRCKKSYMKSQNYICERCGSSASICHHKKYITIDNVNDPEITLNWDNLEALCRNCHNKEHFRDRECFLFDENGDLIKK